MPRLSWAVDRLPYFRSGVLSFDCFRLRLGVQGESLSTWRMALYVRETGDGTLALVREPARRTACCLYTRSRVRCRFGRRRSVCVKAFVHSPSVACLHPSWFVDDLSLVAVESRAGGARIAGWWMKEPMHALSDSETTLLLPQEWLNRGNTLP